MIVRYPSMKPAAATSSASEVRAFQLVEPGSIAGLKRVEMAAPEPGAHDVVVRMRAASANPRDLMVIIGPSTYGPKQNLIPLSDGAGEVVRVGAAVTRFRPGNRVVAAFRPAWISGPLRPEMIASDLGGGGDGVLADEVCLPAAALVPIPDALSFEAAATLPCAAVTAYRGLDVPSLTPGMTVLIQGAGGVSLFALQMALAAESSVIAVTAARRGKS